MKAEDVLDCIGQIDDDMIAEANGAPERIRGARPPWLRWAAAAVACLLVAVPFALDRAQPTEPVTDADILPTEAVDTSRLPMLTVDTDFGTYGFEGYMAYDIGELQNGNPWTADNTLTTMPVYRNPHIYDSAGAPVTGLSPEEMRTEAETVAALFNMDIINIYTEPSAEQLAKIIEKLGPDASEEDLRQNTNVYRATAECNGATVQIEKDGRVTLRLTAETAGLAHDIGKLAAYNHFSVVFQEALPMPDGSLLSLNDAAYKQALAMTQQLFAAHGAFTCFTSPGYDLPADYTYSGDRHRLHTAVFENTGSLTERIRNYHFHRLSFIGSVLGGLYAIQYDNTDLSQKIGDYPIITADEARTLLLDGCYITSVPEAMPGESYIAHAELTYRTSRLDSIMMPYYNFLVEIPSMARENGLITFGAYYVPAVRGDFLKNIPTWDGRFN